MHFLIVVRVTRETPSLSSQTKRVKSWLRHHFTGKNTKKMYNRFESEHPPPYEDESSERRGVIEICDMDDEKDCSKHEAGAGAES